MLHRSRHAKTVCTLPTHNPGSCLLFTEHHILLLPRYHFNSSASRNACLANAICISLLNALQAAVTSTCGCVLPFKKKEKGNRGTLRHERPGKKSRKPCLPLSRRWRTCARKMAFPAAGERKEWTRLPMLTPAERTGGVSVDSNFTAGWRHTHTHTAPRVLSACARCLIALNCGTVFSTQTSVSLAAPPTEQVGVGKKKGTRGVSF